MDFKSYLKTSSSQVQERAIALLYKWQRETIDSNTPVLLPHIDLFIESVSGGKGLRGTLVKLGYELTGHRADTKIIDMAAAVEIVHTALLIQDDIMDKSPLRRSKPSIYCALGNNHYGISQAICLGDLGLYLGIKIISECNFPEKSKNQAISVFSDIIINTIIGQMLDVYYSISKPKRESEILTMYRLKTAQYTFVGPLLVGANLVNVSDRLLLHLKAFGENLGIAYQIQDDILGCFGEEKETGKSVNRDITEGKNTLLFAVAYKHAIPQVRRTLTSLYGKQNITLDQNQKVKEILKQMALSYCQTKADEYIEKAHRLVPILAIDKRSQTLFEDMCQFLAKRKK